MMGGREWGNAKAQGRNEKQGEIPAYAGMTGGGREWKQGRVYGDTLPDK